MNVVTLVGRLVRDPDLRYTQQGHAVANFTIAINRPFKGENGQQEADFINCVAWRKPAENLANYMKKGNRIGVSGSIQTRSFEGQDGKTVYVTEVLANNIEFLESKSSGGQSGQPAAGGRQAPSRNQSPADDPFKDTSEPIDITDDDLPF